MEAEALWQRGLLRPAGLGRSGEQLSAVRGDQTAWLDEANAPPALASLLLALSRLQRSLNQAAYLGLTRVEVQLARYPCGGERYQRHRDAFSGRASRRVTALHYLNPGWKAKDGGQLLLHLPERTVAVSPALDGLVVFLSEEVDHEVLPAFAPRFATSTWFSGNESSGRG